mmetsp:Transcript_116145/g.329150  ORF Transcript_116145/g.329150 Transcript_116145/m.329150 type:complete len:384 (+) Transcript_116145:541-1692(+)
MGRSAPAAAGDLVRCGAAAAGGAADYVLAKGPHGTLAATRGGQQGSIRLERFRPRLVVRHVSRDSDGVPQQRRAGLLPQPPPGGRSLPEVGPPRQLQDIQPLRRGGVQLQWFPREHGEIPLHRPLPPAVLGAPRLLPRLRAVAPQTSGERSRHPLQGRQGEVGLHDLRPPRLLRRRGLRLRRPAILRVGPGRPALGRDDPSPDKVGGHARALAPKGRRGAQQQPGEQLPRGLSAAIRFPWPVPRPTGFRQLAEHRHFGAPHVVHAHRAAVAGGREEWQGRVLVQGGHRRAGRGEHRRGGVAGRAGLGGPRRPRRGLPDKRRRLRALRLQQACDEAAGVVAPRLSPAPAWILMDGVGAGRQQGVDRRDAKGHAVPPGGPRRFST